MGVPKNAFGAPLVTLEPRTGRELIVTTHDFCKPTTWYSTSERVTAEALTDTGDGLTWQSTHAPWVDMTHGWIWDEDAICLDVEHGYSVVVTVDGTTKAQRAPFATSGGDFTVDYLNGTVTFASSQAGKTVLATFSKVVDSTFILQPDQGTRINVECAEAQFSSDVEMNDSIVFQLWAYNPHDLPNKVCEVENHYKRMANFFDESLASFPINPPLGGSVRGTQSSSVCLQFRYATARPMLSSQGVELRVSLKNNQPYGGEHAIAALYCTVSDE